MTATAVPPSDTKEPGPPVVHADERLSHRGPMQRWLISPEIGALIGAVIVWIFFWGNARTFGQANSTLNWLDVAAPTGHHGDGSRPVDDRWRVRPVIRRDDRRQRDHHRPHVSKVHGRRHQHRLGDRRGLSHRRSRRLVQRVHGQQDRPTQLHRDACLVLRSQRHGRRAVPTPRRQGSGRLDHQAAWRRRVEELGGARVAVQRVLRARHIVHRARHRRWRRLPLWPVGAVVHPTRRR